MILELADNTPKTAASVTAALELHGLRARQVTGGGRTLLVIIDPHSFDAKNLVLIPGVAAVRSFTVPYPLASREVRPEDTRVRIGDVVCGGKGLILIAGPCAVENREQALAVARAVAASGANVFRGGAYKPRTSPYTFNGLSEEALAILREVREETGLPLVVEAPDHEIFDLVEETADAVQIGARNMQNYSLLKRAGRSKHPIVLKRSPAATVEEWLLAAEHILAGGNPRVILCERGIRSFVDQSRYILDLSAVIHVRRVSHLPVIADPSHAAGRRELVEPLALAAVASGARGLMVEVHHDPDQALSDGAQSINPHDFEKLGAKAHRVHAAAGPDE